MSAGVRAIWALVQPGRRKSPESSDAVMPVMGHLDELRSLLRLCLGVWLAASVVSFSQVHEVMLWILHPLTLALRMSHTPFRTPVFTSPTEGISLAIEVSLVAGLLLSWPILLWRVWAFIRPALRKQERKLVFPLALSSIVLFLVGGSVAYVVMPIGLGFLASFLGPGTSYLPDIGQYGSFFLILVAAFGITFELPVAIVLLGISGVVHPVWFRSHRKQMWLWIVIGALIITPGTDPFTPTALAIPLILLFEAGVAVALRWKRTGGGDKDHN